MARVPLAQGPQVERTALQGGYLNPVDTTAGLRQAAQIASTVADGFERRALRDAEAEANDADVKITAGWLEWDAQARQKYRGANVGEYEVEAKKWWDKQAEDYGKALSPLARERVGPALGRKRNQAMASVFSHSEQERERHLDQTNAAAISSTVQFSVSNNDPVGGAERIRSLVAQRAAVKGWTTEQVQAEQQRQLGALHTAMIAKMANEDAAKAQDYYTKAKDRGEVPASMQADIERTLKGEADNQFARTEASRLYALPPEERASALSKITDPVRQDKTRTALNNLIAVEREAQATREKQFSDRAWQMVGQNQRVPEEVLRNMDGRERVQLQDYLRQRAEHLATKGREPVKTDPATLAKLLDLQAQDPARFAKEFRAEAFAYRISGSDLEQLSKAQRDLLNPKPEKDLVSFNNKVTARIEMMGATGERHAEKRGQFRTAAQKELERFIAANKRPPKPEEEEQILDRLMLPGKTWFGGDSDTYGESVATGKSFVPKIGSADRKLIIDALKAEGVKAPTDEQIMARFKLAKGIK